MPEDPKDQNRIRLSRRGGDYWTLKPGDMLAHFKIVKEVSRGGSGTVYQGFEESMNRAVAIKLLSREYADDKQYVEHFYQEARSVARLHHPNIVQILYIGEQGDKIFYVMEFFEGEEVAELLKKNIKFSVADCTQLIRHVAQGLEYAHRHGIIHRDIKPSNIMLTAESVAKISDFALAKELRGDKPITDTGRMSATPFYLAPEYARGGKIDHRSDIYSLGCTFYHLLTGVPPYDGPSTAAILIKHMKDPIPAAHTANPQCSMALSAIVGRMMAKSPDDRYVNYHELLIDLDQLVTRGLTSASEAGTHPTDKIGVRRARSSGGTTTTTTPTNMPSGPNQKKEGSNQSTPLVIAVGVGLVLLTLWFFFKPGDAKKAIGPPPVQEQVEAPIPPAIPVVVEVLDTYPLDLSGACNADMIWSATHRPPEVFDPYRQQPTTWVTASLLTVHGKNSAQGLPEDGKLKMPPKSNFKGFFQLAPFGSASVIALSTTPRGAYSKVVLSLLPTQQQRYKSLVILHASSGGNGRLHLTLHYEGGGTQSSELNLIDWRNVGTGRGNLPASCFDVWREVEGGANPFGIFPFDLSKKNSDAGLVAQVVSNVDSSRKLEKITFSRPVAITPPPQLNLALPENDRLIAGIFAINAVPENPKEWALVQSDEQKFHAEAADVVRLLSENKISDVIALYNKIIQNHGAHSNIAKLAQIEATRIQTEESQRQQQQVFLHQKEVSQKVAAALESSDNLAGEFRYSAAGKILGQELEKVTDAEVKSILLARQDNLKRMAEFHEWMVAKLIERGQPVNWVLRNGSRLQGTVDSADEKGGVVSGQRTSWKYIAPQSMIDLYKNAAGESKGSLQLAFALICLDQKPDPWPGAADALNRAEKLDPALGGPIASCRAHLVGAKPGEDLKTAEANNLLGRISDAVSGRRWDEAWKVLGDLKNVSAKPDSMSAEQKKMAEELTKQVTDQYQETVAARAEGVLAVKAYQITTARRGEYARDFGKVVAVRAGGGGDFPNIQSAIDSATGPIAIELGAGLYSEQVVIKDVDKIALFAYPGEPAILDRLTVGDNFTAITLDGMIFPSSEGEGVKVGRAKPGGSQVLIRNCAFVGRGIRATESGVVFVVDSVFGKRGLNVGPGVNITASHCLFLSEANLLAAGSTRLSDNLFVSSPEAWILSDDVAQDFVSDYNGFQLLPSGKFARSVVSSETKTTYSDFADWQTKTKRDLHSIHTTNGDFVDPIHGNYSLLPTSPFYAKASDNSAKQSKKFSFGPRWEAIQWSALQNYWTAPKSKE